MLHGERIVNTILMHWPDQLLNSYPYLPGKHGHYKIQYIESALSFDMSPEPQPGGIETPDAVHDIIWSAILMV